MKSLLKSKKGLSTVVTTLIILVVSVLLATVVTFYAINVTTTRVAEESLQVYKLHTWHDGGTNSQTAFIIINTGGRDVVFDKITVRGQECAWTSVFYNKTTDTINNDLSYNSTLTDGGTITIGTTPYTSVSDIGVTVGINVFTANAQYYKEANVEASS